MSKSKIKSRRSKFNVQLRTKLKKMRYIIIKNISTKKLYNSKIDISKSLKKHLKDKWGILGVSFITKELDIVHFSPEPVNLAILSIERCFVPMIRTILPMENFQTVSVHGSIRKAKQIAIAKLKMEIEKTNDSRSLQMQMLKILEVGSKVNVALSESIDDKN